MDNKNILRYYLETPEEEISSDISKKIFEIWNLIEKYRKSFRIGKRLIDVGCGKGKFAIKAVKEGYDVFAVDIVKIFLDDLKAVEPKISTHMLNIFSSKAVSDFVHKFGQFNIVVALGLVLNHAAIKKN